MRIALIAHDKKKADMVEFCKEHESILSKYDLVGTGTTSTRIMESTNLKIECMKSGPLGGDQEIGSMVTKGEIDLVLFFRDPLTSQPHEPDINALLRLCDVYKIPFATHTETASLLIDKF